MAQNEPLQPMTVDCHFGGIARPELHCEVPQLSLVALPILPVANRLR